MRRDPLPRSPAIPPSRKSGWQKIPGTRDLKGGPGLHPGQPAARRWALAKLVLLAVWSARLPVPSAGCCPGTTSRTWPRQPVPGPVRDDAVLPPRVQPAWGRVPGLDAGRLRDWCPGCSSAGSFLAIVATSTCPAPRGSSASGRPRTGGSSSPARPPAACSASSACPCHRGRASLRWEHSRSASLSTATRSGPATSRPPGSGPSSGSRAAGCSPYLGLRLQGEQPRVPCAEPCWPHGDAASHPYKPLPGIVPGRDPSLPARHGLVSGLDHVATPTVVDAIRAAGLLGGTGKVRAACSGTAGTRCRARAPRCVAGWVGSVSGFHCLEGTGLWFLKRGL